MGHSNGGVRNKGNGDAVNWLRARVSFDKDYCLIWPFSTVRGYGNFGYEGKPHYAHRFMCELVHGSAPSDLHQAAHSCGNGHHGCVNPRHLSWKTNGENQLDRTEHGTRNRWSWGWRGKLTPDQVAAIRRLRGHKTQDEIAKEFNTSRRNIGAILSGKTWAEGKQLPRTFSPAEVQEIRNSTETAATLARQFKTSHTTIWRIKNGQYRQPQNAVQM